MSPHKSQTCAHLIVGKKMVIDAAAAGISITGIAAVCHKRMGLSLSGPGLGRPAIAQRGRVRCSTEEKPSASNMNDAMSKGAALLAATSAATMSSPVLALVDERMSTEGTGLSLGVSNNLLGWILAGVFGLIWALYFVYTSSLEEDEDSGLSL